MEKKDGGGSGVNALTSLAEVTILTQAAVEMRVVTTTLGKVKVTEKPFTRFNVSVTLKRDRRRERKKALAVGLSW